jgi:head-tail adaptor
MSFGKMNTKILIISTMPVKDAEGFATKGKNILAVTRAYKEDRHGNTAWKNRAAFSTATALFRFRVIPKVTVTPAMLILCGSDYYNILSVEDVRGRSMYIEALAEKVVSNG